MKIIPISHYNLSKINVIKKIQKSFSTSGSIAKKDGLFKNIRTHIKSKRDKQLELPFVTTPLVVYATVKKTTNEREIKKAEEAINNYIPNNTAWNEEQSRKMLKKAGITTKKEQDRYIGSDGTLNDAGNKKINFKGTSDDIQTQPYVANADCDGDMPGVYEPEDYELIQQDPELLADLRELNSMDAINLPPQLQNIYDAPSFDSAAELIRDILGDDYSDLANIDWDFWSILDAIGDSIVDIGDWL